ncbi:MAG: hypothetical protein ACIAXF_16565, partial [Phycisphaerales bacterium JB063]
LNIGLDHYQSPVGIDDESQDWSDADLVFAEILNQDARFVSSGDALFMTQAEAAKAWSDFLQRDDLEPRHRIVANWRIIAIHTTNRDIRSGEEANYDLAEEAAIALQEASEDLVSHEVINSMTLYLSLPGSQQQRFGRLSKSYRWFQTRSDEILAASAGQVTGNGFLVGEPMVSGFGTVGDASDEKVQRLRSQLNQAIRAINQRITYQLSRERDLDVQSASNFLESIEDVAPPDLIRHWRSIVEDRALEGSRGEIDVFDSGMELALQEGGSSTLSEPIKNEEEPDVSIASIADQGPPPGTKQWSVWWGLIATGAVVPFSFVVYWKFKKNQAV